jgi:hypothetical protein
MASDANNCYMRFWPAKTEKSNLKMYLMVVGGTKDKKGTH